MCFRPLPLSSHRHAASKRVRSPDAKTRTRSVQLHDGPALFPPAAQPGTLPKPEHNNVIPIAHGNVGRGPLPKRSPPAARASETSPDRRASSSSPRTTARVTPMVRVTSDESSPSKRASLSPRTARASAPSPGRGSLSSPKTAQHYFATRRATTAGGTSRVHNVEALATRWTDAVERLMSDTR